MVLPAVRDVGNIIVAAVKDGTLDVTTDYITLKQMERITLTMMDRAAAKAKEAELHRWKKKPRREQGGIS